MPPKPPGRPMSTRRTSRLPRALAVTAAAATAVTLSSGPALASGPASGGHHHHHHHNRHHAREAQIQLLSFNDLHGNLEPPAGSSGRITTGYTESTASPFTAVPTNVDAGGTQYLATHL